MKTTIVNGMKKWRRFLFKHFLVHCSVIRKQRVRVRRCHKKCIENKKKNTRLPLPFGIGIASANEHSEFHVDAKDCGNVNANLANNLLK